MKLGDRVLTPRGPGRVVAFHREPDASGGHGRIVRGDAFVLVELEYGGRRFFSSRAVAPAEER